MDADNKNIDITASADPSVNEYGGSQYRLSYNKYNGIPAKKADRINPVSVIVALVIFSLFIIAGFVIFRYYNDRVDQIHNSSDKMSKTNITFQAYTESIQE